MKIIILWVVFFIGFIPMHYSFISGIKTVLAFDKIEQKYPQQLSGPPLPGSMIIFIISYVLGYILAALGIFVGFYICTLLLFFTINFYEYSSSIQFNEKWSLINIIGNLFGIGSYYSAYSLIVHYIN